MNAVFIVIDPQKGFTSRDGTLGRIHGVEELEPVRLVLHKLADKLPLLARSAQVAVVTSRYRNGQFDPVQNGPLFRLCVPGLSCDCEMDEAIANFPFEYRFVKSEQSALSDSIFEDWVFSEQNQDTMLFLIGGFLLEHCVLDTALDLRRGLPSSKRVIVLNDLVASRASKYFPDGEFDQALSKLKSAGIEISSSNEFIDKISN